MSILGDLSTGLAVLRHSIRQVLGNAGDALRLSALPYIGGLVLLSGVLALISGWTEPGRAQAFILLAAFLPVALGYAWFAIAWHRFVLRDEPGQGFVPPWHGRALFVYAGQAIGLTLITLFAVLPVLMAFMPVSVWLLPTLWPGVFTTPPGRFLAGQVAQFPGLAVMAWLGLRLGLVLPAAALGTGATLRGSWRATRGIGGALVWLALAGALLMFSGNIVNAALGTGSAVAMAFGAVTSWATLLLSASVLTTLYGHVIEQRPLN